MSEAGVPIGTVVERTGVSATVLRSWEQRYGFPVPTRNAGGHRRYSEVDVARIQDVLRARADGRSLERAIELAVADEPDGRSLFAGVRRLAPDLRAQDLSRRAMLALSRAIEDECAARAARPLLIGSFQEGAAFRRSERRWTELARTSARTVVFGVFEEPWVGGPLVQVSVGEGSPLRREWAVVCDDPELTVCLVGWERLDDGRRREHPPFEAVWSVDPEVVRGTARLALALAGEREPEEWAAGSPAASPGTTGSWAVAVANRALAELDGA
jgi:DNA-binding transcriptional MerR regulator